MALDDTRFSHITVTDDEDDDVVIHAGARPVAAGGAARNEAPAPAPEDPRDADPAAARAGEQAAPADPPSSSKAGKEYRETTAEDLEAGPMSLMQKVIIVVAVLLVIAFAVYYMFLR